MHTICFLLVVSLTFCTGLLTLKRLKLTSVFSPLRHPLKFHPYLCLSFFNAQYTFLFPSVCHLFPSVCHLPSCFLHSTLLFGSLFLLGKWFSRIVTLLRICKQHLQCLYLWKYFFILRFARVIFLVLCQNLGWR